MVVGAEDLGDLGSMLSMVLGGPGGGDFVTAGRAGQAERRALSERLFADGKRNSQPPGLALSRRKCFVLSLLPRPPIHDALPAWV